MSGRGRGRGRSRGSGRGHGRSSGRGANNQSKNTTTTKSKAEEMLFTPYYAGKQQRATCDTVKDYIVQQIQKTYKYGNDIAVAIDEDKDFADKTELGNHEQITITPLPSDSAKVTEALLIQYKEELREVNKCWRTYVDNKFKAYAYIFRQCNKAMQTRLENDTDFKSKIKNKPLELLKVIKMKMYDPSKVKNPFITLTEQME